MVLDNGFIQNIFYSIEIILATLIYIYYAPFMFTKKGSGDERSKMRLMSAYQQLLDEPITRAQLKEFMKVLIQEER